MKNFIPKYFFRGVIILLMTFLSASCCKEKPIDTKQDKQTKTDKEYKRLKDKVHNKENELEEAEDELDEVEDELEEVEDELEEIEKKLKNNQDLTTAERKKLEEQKRTLESQKSTLENRITSLTGDITRLRGERDRALQERDEARRQKTTAETERDCWKKTTGNFCHRHSKVVARIIAKIPKTDCAEVNYCDLETITNLDLSGSYDPGDHKCSDYQFSVQPSDFLGLTKLETLDLSGNCINTMMPFTASSGFFRELDSIRQINLQDTDVYKLSKNFFNGILDTLEDGKVLVTDFTYCSSPESPYKSKLGEREGTNENFVGNSRLPANRQAEFCY